MARFVPGTDTTVQADEPLLEVAIDTRTRLPVGRHVFQLVVVDDSGNESAPALVSIIVQDQERPTAVIDTIDARGTRSPEPTVAIPFGQRFSLTGERSSDVGGAVRQWRWTLMRA